MEQGQDAKLEQNRQESPMSLLSKSLLTGFIGGVLWSFFATIAYYFNFSSVSPGTFILRSWIQKEWTNNWLGELISIMIVGALSVVIALIYYGVLKKTKGMIPAIGFGIALWFIVFFLLQPIFEAVPSVMDMDINTIVTTLCLYILYGTFIGYSISYEYHNANQPNGMEQQTGN